MKKNITISIIAILLTLSIATYVAACIPYSEYTTETETEWVWIGENIRCPLEKAKVICGNLTADYEDMYVCWGSFEEGEVGTITTTETYNCFGKRLSSDNKYESEDWNYLKVETVCECVDAYLTTADGLAHYFLVMPDGSIHEYTAKPLKCSHETMKLSHIYGDNNYENWALEI